VQLEAALRRVALPSSLGELRGLLLAQWPLVLLSGVVLAGFALRVVEITDNPRGFFADEASFGVNAHLILTTLKDEHGALLPTFFRSFGEYKLPLFVYAELPLIAVLGKTELAVRLTAAVIGSLTIVTTYLLGKELFRRELPALASATLLAIMPWHIHYSRTGLGDIISAPLLVTLSLYLFLRAVRRGSSMLPVAVAIGVTFYTYRATWVLMPPVLAVLCLMYYRELLRDRRDSLISAAVLLLILLPIARHLIFDPDDRATQAWIFNLDRDQSTLSLFWDFYTSYFTRAFLFENADNAAILRHYLPGHGVLYVAMAPLIVAGLVRMVRDWDRNYALLLALLLLFPLGGALSESSPISSRAILGTVAFALLMGAGLALIVDWASSFRFPYGGIASAAVLSAAVIIGAVSVASYAERYFSDYPRLSAGYWGWQDGPQDVIKRFLAMQDSYDELYLDGQFNAPHIFYDFYAGEECAKCRIGGPDRFDPAKRQLFALRTENPELPKYRYQVRETLRYPDGSPSFLLVEIQGPSSGSVDVRALLY
jgi:hypothetical protein